MIEKTINFILKISGILIMLFAFMVVPDSKPWYYAVVLFDVGLLLVLTPKFPKIMDRSKK